MTPGPAAWAPAPIVGKMPPSIVPRPIAVNAGHPNTRRRVGPDDADAVHPSGWHAKSCLTKPSRAKRSRLRTEFPQRRLGRRVRRTYQRANVHRDVAAAAGRRQDELDTLVPAPRGGSARLDVRRGLTSADRDFGAALDADVLHRVVQLRVGK